MAVAVKGVAADAVEVVGADAFAALRPRWDALFAADRNALFFQSSSWVRGLSEAPSHDAWCALVLRDPSDDVPFALLPFARRTIRYRGLVVERQIVLGGDLGDASGMLCRAGREEEAIEAFAMHLRERERWETLLAQDVADPRLRRLVDETAREFAIASGTATAMPYVTLPEAWETYLATKLSKRRREDLRRAIRDLAALPGWRCERVTATTFDHDFDVMMAQRHARWGGNLEEQKARFRPLMRRLLADGRLVLDALRSGDDVVAMIGGFTDPEHATFWYYWGTFHAGYRDISPGKGSFGIAIRDAIAAGFQTFSFTYGDESYKATFGTDETFCQDLRVQRPSLRAAVVKSVFTAGSRAKRAVRGLR